MSHFASPLLMRALMAASIPMLAVPAQAQVRAAASPGVATLAEVSKALAATTSMTASFSQTGADGRVLNGRMSLARPGRVRFEYDDAKILLVGDGRKLTFVDYAVRQVSQWPVKSTPLGILLSAAPDLTGVATIVAGDARAVIVEARDPRRPEFGTLSIRFVRDGAAPGGLRLDGWVARDAQGGESEIRLADVRYNADLKGVDWGFRDPRRRPARAG